MEKTKVELRLLDAADAKAFFELRMRGLQLHPDAFGQDHTEFAVTPIEEVASRLGPKDDGSCVIGAFAPELVAVVGLSRNDRVKTHHKAIIWGMFVQPEHRQLGISRMLMMQAIERAKATSGIEEILLTVVTNNGAALSLYRSLGFESYGVEPHALKVGTEYFDEEHMRLRTM